MPPDRRGEGSEIPRQRISDPCGGMYLLRTEKLRGLELTSGGFDVEVEVAAQMPSFGKVVEVPISYGRRVGGRKLPTWRSGFSILLTAWKMCWLYNPVLLFPAITALLAFPGAIILLWQLYMRYLHGAGAWSLGWTWPGLALLITGLQGFTISTISLLLKRMERRILAQTRKADKVEGR